MATNYSGKQWSCVVGTRDQSGTNSAIGDSSGTAYNSKNYAWELDAINGISFDAAIQSSEAVKAGRRMLHDEDMVQHYGSGTWTWDFDMLIKTEAVIQQMTSLIYNGADTSGDPWLTIPAAPVFEDLSHGATGDVDRTADVILLAPTVPTGVHDEDMRMHSSVLQNLTLSMDMGTDAGRLRASGQFMSGYKPVISDSGLTAADSTPASNYEKGLFDCTTRSIFGISDATIKAFSVTISNPATRVGFIDSGETDGYVRGGAIDVTGSVTVKYDSSVADLLTNNYLVGAGASGVIEVGDSSNFTFNLAAARLTGFNKDYAEDGMFVELPFKATAGADGASVPLIVKTT